MRFIVERVEENIASLENMETGEIISYHVQEIPFQIVEGDVLIFENNDWNHDVQEKNKRHNRISKKMQELWTEE